MMYCFVLKVSIQSLSPVYLQKNLIFFKEISCVISVIKVKTCLFKLRKLIWGPCQCD